MQTTVIKKIITNKEQLAIPSKEINDPELIRAIIQDLKDTAIYHAKSKVVGCAGLAANQIGYLHRIILVNYSGQWVPMINPSIERVPGCKSSLAGEGCLSRPGIHRKIRRDKKIIIRFWDEDEDLIEEEVKNFAARVIAHECDHLDGEFI